MRAYKLILLGVALALFLALSALVLAGEVIQGTCLAYDTEAKTITLKNELDQAEVVIDVSKAKIGMKPEAGNLLRIALHKEGDKLVAFKVMNVTKQSLRK